MTPPAQPAQSAKSIGNPCGLGKISGVASKASVEFARQSRLPSGNCRFSKSGVLKMAKTENAGDQIVAVDRRRGSRRTMADANEAQVRAIIAQEKKSLKTQRRRQIDPTTCERDYSGDEVEFMQAMDAYKRQNGRMFPTCSEILEVIRNLGYSRPDRNANVVALIEPIDIIDEKILAAL